MMDLIRLCIAYNVAGNVFDDITNNVAVIFLFNIYNVANVADDHFVGYSN